MSARLTIPTELTGQVRRRRRALGVGGTLLVLGGAVAAWILLSHKATALYRTDPVSRRTIVRAVEATGQVDVPQRVEVSAPGPGWLARISVTPGATVRRGDLLAQLDDTSVSLLVRSARSSLWAGESRIAESRAALESARAVAERTRRLAGRGLASDAELEAARAAETRARAALGSSRAERAVAAGAVTAAEVQQRLTAIRAPSDGVVLVAPSRIGATVGPDGRLFVLGSTLEAMHVEVSVAEADVAAVHPGQIAHFTVPAFPEQTFEARVLRVDPEAQRERTSVTYGVTLAAENPDHLLFPGMTATVHIDVAHADRALVVREAALRFTPRSEQLQERGHRSRIWKLGAGGRIAPVDVDPGVSDGAYTEIRVHRSEDLGPGDLIVIGLASPEERTARGPGVTLGRR
jgi:HlyD family secretion protein